MQSIIHIDSCGGKEPIRFQFTIASNRLYLGRAAEANITTDTKINFAVFDAWRKAARF